MKYPKAILDKLNSITDKRPATVIQHILDNGYITTEELENIYGYKHPQSHFFNLSVPLAACIVTRLLPIIPGIGLTKGLFHKKQGITYLIVKGCGSGVGQLFRQE